MGTDHQLQNGASVPKVYPWAMGVLRQFFPGSEDQLPSSTLSFAGDALRQGV